MSMSNIVSHGHRSLRAFARSLKFHAYCRRRFAASQTQFAKAVYGQDAIKVLAGPFAGMTYFNEVVWGPITPKWIGSYECELSGIIDAVVARPYRRVVDVGCAEGYYAVGLALRMPHVEVITYDTDFLARRLVRKLAALNGVTARLEVRQECTHATLEEDLAAGQTLVITDIEGAEAELLDPGACSLLVRNDILAECHPWKGESMGQVRDRLIARFEYTHGIEILRSIERRVGEWVDTDVRLAPIHEGVMTRALDECRSESQTWLWMRSNSVA